MKRWFITGTDTGVGKTHAACALVRRLVENGQRVAVMKPVASGCDVTVDGLRNEDALALMAAANVTSDYRQVNPYAFEPAIAPHLAARQAGVDIDLEHISALARGIKADHLVVEGAGGWNVPLDDERMFADLARTLADEVVMVVGLKLGCINHALLTANQVQADGFTLAGWVANTLDPHMPVLQENLDTLRSRLPVPLLDILPFQTGERCAGVLNWPPA